MYIIFSFLLRIIISNDEKERKLMSKGQTAILQLYAQLPGL